jgi:dGTPase
VQAFFGTIMTTLFDPIWHDRFQSRSETRQGDHRSPYQRDKARVLHSAAFRRLQAKTQVLGVGLSDFYRTRLTHSLEAAQIGTGICAQLQAKYPQQTVQLQLDATLIETLCLAHDIGHPPFGHGGEVALNYMMREWGNFEGNGQTFRIVTKLEPYTQNNGMNLTRRSLLGLVKYPNFIDQLNKNDSAKSAFSHRQVVAKQWIPAKGLFRCDQENFDWMLAPLCHDDRENLTHFSTQPDKHGKTLCKSIDCSIMELADDIAYGIHDLEDAIVMGIVEQSQFVESVVQPIQQLDIEWLSDAMVDIGNKLFNQQAHVRKNTIGALVNCFITSIELIKLEQFRHQLLDYNATFPLVYKKALDVFKMFVYEYVIKKTDIQLLEYKGQQVVMELFEAFASDPERLLPANTRQRWIAANDELGQFRVISDYISGMTDEFASRLYTNMFVPKRGGTHDSLAL